MAAIPRKLGVFLGRSSFWILKGGKRVEIHEAETLIDATNEPLTRREPG
jgi:hypothetical protein